jgi:glycogen operon protein
VTLLLSTGVPMLRSGDELGHTQRGNNNAYCQDNEISWLDWDPPEAFGGCVDLVARLTALRRSHPVFRRQEFFHGRAVTADGANDAAWFGGSGAQLTEQEFWAPGTHSIGMYVSGFGIPDLDSRGEPITDDSFLLLLHAGDTPWTFTLPGKPWASSYVIELRTDAAAGEAVRAGGSVELAPRSAVLLRVAG